MRAMLEDMAIGESRALLHAHFPEPRPDLVLVDGGAVLPREPGGFAVRRGPNWPVIAFIVGAHAALLFALITLDVIPILKAPKPKPMVVEMLALKPPPPIKPARKVEAPVQVVTKITVPPPEVPVPTPPPPAITVTTVAPPPKAEVAPPPPAGPIAAGDLDSKTISAPAPKYP